MHRIFPTGGSNLREIVTSMRLKQFVLTILSSPCCLVGGIAQTPCTVLTDPVKVTLLRLQEQEYGIVSPSSLFVKTAALVSGSCYYKLTLGLRSDGHDQAVEGTLFLSPDRRFLSRDLVDLQQEGIGKALVSAAYHIEQELSSISKRVDHLLGSAQAEKTIHVFSDYQCRYCKEQATILKSALERNELPNTKVIFHFVPIRSHDWAFAAAKAAVCTGSREVFLAMNAFLFEQQEQLTLQNIHKHVLEEQQSIDPEHTAEFESCFLSPTSKELEQELLFAERHNVKAVPTLFIKGLEVSGETELATIQRLLSVSTKDVVLGMQ